jgi:glucokinase
MILAGDVGGTKSHIGLFHAAERRPTLAAVGTFPTTEFPGLPAIIEAFFDMQPRRERVSYAAFGVAGPVIDQAAQMTNITWAVDARELTAALDGARVTLLNDLEAMAHAVPVLGGDELHTLQRGQPQARGNLGVIAAGTGLGGAFLHWLDGAHHPVASEIGHSDFAARTDRELEFVRFARARFGRVEIEHVLCGPGLVNLAEFTHGDEPCGAFAVAAADLPAAIARSALAIGCARCADALTMFVDAYGAVAGNLALTAVTTGGMFIGGGIAPRILPALTSGRLVAAFNDKGPMRPLLEGIPVHVILNHTAGLLGAAVYANAAIRRRAAR